MAERPISRRDLFTFWRKPPAAAVPRDQLRPPGAIGEAAFVDQCIRCGSCISVCPADAIVAIDEPGRAFGTPKIIARAQACVLCNGLQCTQSCPSGALQPLRFHHEIKMGTARVEASCKLEHGEACDVCIRECPVPSALSIRDGRIAVDANVCVGCGACEQHCPTEPTSIRVIPR